MIVIETQPGQARRKRIVLAFAACLVALAAVATACGGSSTKTSSSSTTSPPTSGSAATGSAATGSGATGSGGSAAFAAARTKFTQCLESHGVPASVASSGFGFGGRRGSADGSGATGSTGSGSTNSGSSTAGGSTTRPTIASQYQSAFTACRSDLPTGGFGGGGFNSVTSAAYRNCLTLHGVTIPTTPPSTAAGSSGPRAGPGGLGALRNNPKFQAAQKACASLLPARTGAGTTTTVPAAS